jgi:hypothetical protein
MWKVSFSNPPIKEEMNSSPNFSSPYTPLPPLWGGQFCSNMPFCQQIVPGKVYFTYEFPFLQFSSQKTTNNKYAIFPPKWAIAYKGLINVYLQITKEISV